MGWFVRDVLASDRVLRLEKPLVYQNVCRGKETGDKIKIKNVTIWKYKTFKYKNT